MSQSIDDWCLNNIITSIGRREEYREELISALKGYNTKVSGKESIKQLESLLEKQRNKSNAKK